MCFFGLFHGLGFANVLAPLGLSGAVEVRRCWVLTSALELGQLALILAVFPLLFLLRKWSGYRPLVLQAGSVALLLVASFWFFERTIDIPFLSADTFKFAATEIRVPAAEAVAPGSHG